MTEEGGEFAAQLGSRFEEIDFEAAVLTTRLGVAVYSDNSDPDVGIQLAMLVRGRREDIDSDVELSFMLTERLACGLIAQLMYAVKRAGANPVEVQHMTNAAYEEMVRKFG